MLHDTIYNEKINHYNSVKGIVNEIYPYINIANTILDYIRPKPIVFTEKKATVLTILGKLSNVQFHERDLIFAVSPHGRIKNIKCNYGEICSDDFKDPNLDKKKSNKGRKPKEKKKNNRKNQGTGKCFNSQISFWIQSKDIKDKLYKVKLFRNGTIKIPGCLDPNLEDARDIAEIVRKEINDIFVDYESELISLYPIMRNYKFKTIDDNIRVNLRALFNIFRSFNNEQKKEFNIAEVKFNTERNPGLNVKFSGAPHGFPDKNITIKMLESGKVNIDNSLTQECACHYYNWLNKFYWDHKDEILYTPNFDSDSDSDEDEDEDEDNAT
jgi:hypothetical protein